MAVYRYGISLLVFNSKKNEKNKKKMRFSITCEFLALTRKILGKKCFFLKFVYRSIFFVAFSFAPVYRVLLRLKQNLRNFQHSMVIRWNAAFSQYVMTSSQIFSLPARPNSFNKYILSCLVVILLLLSYFVAGCKWFNGTPTKYDESWNS